MSAVIPFLSMRPKRMISRILASFPWYSNIMYEQEFSAAADEAKDFLTFLQSLRQYESVLFNQFASQDNVVKLQRNLGILFDAQVSESSAIIPATAKSPNANEFSRLCSVVSAYRLVDVLALLGGGSQAGSVERGSFQVLSSKFRGIDKLGNWPEMLLNFRKVLAKAKKPVPLSPQAHDRSAAFRLLRFIARNNNTKSYASIEANFLFAAMHLACMKDLHFPPDVCPDLPDDLSGLVRSNALSIADQDDVDDLATLLAGISASHGSADGVSCMRAPLHLALLISPIYLLLPVQLFKKSYNRHTMLSISQSLGNQKPKILRDVEMSIWRTLFSLASGSLDPLDLLQRLSDQLPWNEIQSVLSTDSDRTWFSLGPSAILMPDSVDGSRDSAAISMHSRVASSDNASPAKRNEAPECPGEESSPGRSPSLASPPLTKDKSLPITAQGQEEISMAERAGYEGSPPNDNEEISMAERAGYEGSPPHDNSGSEASEEGPQDEGAAHSPSRHSPPPPLDQGPNDEPEYPETNSPAGDVQMDGIETEQCGQDTQRPHAWRSPSPLDSDDDCLPENNSFAGIDEDDMQVDSIGIDQNGGRRTDHPGAGRRVSPSPNNNPKDGRILRNQSASRQPDLAPDSPDIRVDRPRKRRRIVLTPSDDGQISASNSSSDSHEVIDVDLYASLWEPRMVKELIKQEEPNLEHAEDICRIKSDSELRAFDASGVEHRFIPEFHFVEHADRVKEFFIHVEATYRDGKPMHITDPEMSTFDVIPYEEFRAMSPSQIQERLRFKHILVTGCPHPNMKFDEAGLRTLCSLDSPVSIQDYSVSKTRPATLTGYARDLLTNGTPNGKILNGLDFPMWKDSQWDRCSYATDMVAWDYVRGKQCCGTVTTPYPTEHMRWGLAGTAHAFTSLHIDSDGFSTFVQVMCGKKVWIVYRPSPDLPLWSTNLFTNGDCFQLDTIPKNAPYGLEAMVLRPGDQLLMRPGVPHYVYGVENTIIHGGHFYCASQMQATVESLVHTFILSDFISNTFHHPSRELLRRIVILWARGLLQHPFGANDDERLHLPNVQTFQGLMDLISGCALAVLGNVLDFRTYSAPNQGEEDRTTKAQLQLWKDFDRNDIPGDERMAICYARGVALAVFGWIRDCCIVKTAGGEVVDDLPSKYLVNLLDALVGYKDKAKEQGLEGAPHCALWMLKAQISNVVKCDKLVETLWGQRTDRSSDSLRLSMDEDCTVQWRDDLPSFVWLPWKTYQENGKTAFDHKFLEGEHRRSQIEVLAVKKQKSRVA